MLNGTVYNGTNEAISPFNFTWTSDKDGIIGTGNNITYFNLSAGDHIITVKVLDSNSSTGNDTVPITITQKGDLNHDGNITSADVRIALTIAFSGELRWSYFQMYFRKRSKYLTGKAQKSHTKQDLPGIFTNSYQVYFVPPCSTMYRFLRLRI